MYKNGYGMTEIFCNIMKIRWLGFILIIVMRKPVFSAQKFWIKKKKLIKTYESMSYDREFTSEKSLETFFLQSYNIITKYD